jgi:hypothetical protein
MKILNTIKTAWVELKIGVSLLFLSLFPSRDQKEEEIIEEIPMRKKPCGPNCKCKA